jgi:two-component system, NtrC family, sensor histidine kinase KinB
MNISIRTKFTIGIVFLFVIISILSIFPALSLHKLSEKTSATLKENHLSIIYARDMTDAILKIDQEVTKSYLLAENPDASLINKEFTLFSKSLQFEVNNITEIGEEKLAKEIETGFTEYHDLALKYINYPKQSSTIVEMQKKISSLYQQLMLLSEINGNAMEFKTNEAKVSAKKALTNMTILGTVCFLITLTFIYNFSTYFNERFYQLYNGINKIVSSNFGYRLYFDGKDEFHEISLVINQMAEKLNEKQQKIDIPLQVDYEKDEITTDIQKLKMILVRMHSIEDEATEIISSIENKK